MKELFETADSLGMNIARLPSLSDFQHDLPDDMRSDRVIASAWDATFTLYDGRPTLDDLERLGLEIGKLTPKTHSPVLSPTKIFPLALSVPARVVGLPEITRFSALALIDG